MPHQGCGAADTSGQLLPSQNVCLPPVVDQRVTKASPEAGSGEQSPPLGRSSRTLVTFSSPTVREPHPPKDVNLSLCPPCSPGSRGAGRGALPGLCAQWSFRGGAGSAGLRAKHTAAFLCHDVRCHCSTSPSPPACPGGARCSARTGIDEGCLGLACSSGVQLLSCALCAAPGSAVKRGGLI